MEPSDFLNKLLFPAFLVENGQIVNANIPALERNIEIGSDIVDLIMIGNDEYLQFAQGTLCLTLKINGTPYNASVTATENMHLFSLETAYDNPQLRAFGLAAQQVRCPLANAFAGIGLLGEVIAHNDEALAQLAQINRNLYQLQRMICNMSDAAPYAADQLQYPETIELVAVFREVLEKSSTLAETTVKQLRYDVPSQMIFSIADKQKLERGILNMLSNALHFSPVGSQINAKLRYVKNRLYFTVENKFSQTFAKEPFLRYLREPGLDLSQSGIGLGLSIVRSVAASHGGALLMELPDQDTVRFTLTLAVTNSNTKKLRSPVQLLTDYAGGKDRALLELSDVLPYQLYSEID